jgi:hypothetical protein
MDGKEGLSEIDAMKSVDDAFTGLSDADARARVLDWAISKFGQPNQRRRETNGARQPSGRSAASGAVESYATLAELHDDAGPQTNAERALVAGYWLQVCGGADDFSGQAVNTLLKDLGHGVANITMAIDTLKESKPALALQTKKSGTTRQARKLYKLTAAGIREVERMIAGDRARNED